MNVALLRPKVDNDNFLKKPISEWDSITSQELFEGLLPLVQNISPAFGAIDHLALLRLPLSGMHDSCILIQILGARNKPLGVIHCSPISAPDTAANAFNKATSIYERLPKELSVHIGVPIFLGSIEGRTYIVSKWGKRLSENRVIKKIEYPVWKSLITKWINQAASCTKVACTTEQAGAHVEEQLQFLQNIEDIPPWIRKATKEAQSAYLRGDWKPFYAFEHNDIWRGNILLPPGPLGYKKFEIIDWGSATLNGYGVSDMINIDRLIKVRAAEKKKLLSDLATSLRISPKEMLYQNLACAGNHGLNQGAIATEKFRNTVIRRLELLRD